MNTPKESLKTFAMLWLKSKNRQSHVSAIDWTGSADNAVIGIQEGIIVLNEEEQSLYEEICAEISELLTLIDRGFADVMEEYQYRIDTISQQLSMEKNLSVADKIVLSSEITALGISRSLVAGARFIMPDTPKDLALEAALSIVGFPLLKRAPRLLRGALAHVDEVAGTKFASKYLSRIT